METSFDSLKDADTAQHIARLITGFIRETLTPSEHDELEEWVVENDENLLLFEQLTDEKELREGADYIGSVRKAAKLRKLKRKLRFNRHRFSFWFFKYAVTTILLLISAQFYSAQ